MTPRIPPSPSTGSTPTSPGQTPAPTPSSGRTEPPRESHRRPFVLEGRLSVGASQHGGINGGLFAIDPIGSIGEFVNYEAAASLLFNLTRGDVQFRVGPELRLAFTQGDEDSGGSSLYSISGGPRAEVDWRRVWGNGLFAGPSRFGMDFMAGMAWGDTTAETFSLHSQSGVELSASAALNLFNVRFAGFEAGVDIFGRTSSIFGGDFNTPFNTLGGALVFRTAEEPPVEVTIRETCSLRDQEDYTTQIHRFQAANRQLREENAEHAQLVAAIRERLEAREITREEMVEELRNGYQDYLANRGENPVTDPAERAALAADRFPDDFDPFLWQEVSPFEVPDPLPTDCDRLRDIERRLREENAELREQRGLLLGLARTGLIRLGIPEGVAAEYTSAIARLRDVNFRTNTPFGQVADGEPGVRGRPVRNERGFTQEASIAAIEQAATAWASGHPIDPATGLGEAAPQADLERVFGPLFPPGQDRTGQMRFQSIDILRDLANALRDPSMREMQIFFVGHTSSPGSDAHNLALSRRRARAIRAFMMMQGIPENRLFFDGRGETELLYQRDGLGRGEPAHAMSGENSTLRRYGIRTAAQRREEALRRQAVNRRMEITVCRPNSADEACTALRADPDIAPQIQAAQAPGAAPSGMPPATPPDTDESATGGGEATPSGGGNPTPPETPARTRPRGPRRPREPRTNPVVAPASGGTGGDMRFRTVDPPDPSISE